MAFRGYFVLDGVEIVNSTRTGAHIGTDVPTDDTGMFDEPQPCELAPIAPGRLLVKVPTSSAPIAPGRLLYTPPNGARLYGEAAAVVGECWSPAALCHDCRPLIGYDDSWPGLSAFLDHSRYRPELAPWASTRRPASAEFSGVWVTSVTGLDVTPTITDVQESAGDGGVAGRRRSPTRRIAFEATLLACTNAGATYGLQWLTTQLLRATGRGVTLRYLEAHPASTAAPPTTLLREVHGVILTAEPRILAGKNPGRRAHEQATTYRISWEMAATRPHAYAPAVDTLATWDTLDVAPISWSHAADCAAPQSCDSMPVMFADDGAPRPTVAPPSPPPVCGGCLPVCEVTTRVYPLPRLDYAARTRQTAVTVIVGNVNRRPLTAQMFWRRCNAINDCNDQLWPLQINALPEGAELVLDAVSGRYWTRSGGRLHRPVGIVGTPTGAPWRPPVLDRSQCWELVVVTAGTDDLRLILSLADRQS